MMLEASVSGCSEGKSTCIPKSRVSPDKSWIEFPRIQLCLWFFIKVNSHNFSYLGFSDCLLVLDVWQVLVLRNFGIFIIAETIEEAFYLTYNVMSAIDAQVGLSYMHVTLLHSPYIITCTLCYYMHITLLHVHYTITCTYIITCTWFLIKRPCIVRVQDKALHVL